jgi:hypothetical protein
MTGSGLLLIKARIASDERARIALTTGLIGQDSCCIGQYSFWHSTE